MSFVFPAVYGEEKPGERSGHIAVHYNGFVVVWGGYHEVENLGLIHFVEDRYHSSEDVWVYNIDNSTWYCQKTSGDVPKPKSGSCAVCIDQKLFLFAGHSILGPTNEVHTLDLRTFQWEEITEKIKGRPPSARDKLTCWQHQENIVFFGGYGSRCTPESIPDDSIIGEYVPNTVETFYSENRGWNNHLYQLDTIRLEWKQPKAKGVAPCPRAAQAATKLGNKAYIFGGRFMETRREDLYSLHLDTFEWNSISTFGLAPEGRTWHSLSAVSTHHVLLYGGFNNNREALGDAWILDTESRIWTRLEGPQSQSGPITRMWHTACTTSIKGEVVIFGGCASSILSETPEHSDSVIMFRYTALPLVRLTMDAVVRHYHLLKTQLKSLPNVLAKTLMLRIKSQRFQNAVSI